MYEDFLMPSRLEQFRGLLVLALGHGYQIDSIGHFWTLSGQGERRPQGKHLVMRYDIDTDTGTAREIWNIAHACGAGGSFFFRLGTLDDRLMQDIAAHGGEVSYHFEELATISKRMHLKTRDAALNAMPRIHELFLSNLQYVRRRTGLPMTIVAAHGDWINLRLHCSNEEVLRDRDLRARAGIDLEAYDQALTNLYDRRYADLGDPLWSPEDPVQAIQSGVQLIQVLVHPRQWRVNIGVNLLDDLHRAAEGVLYALGV